LGEKLPGVGATWNHLAPMDGRRARGRKEGETRTKGSKTTKTGKINTGRKGEGEKKGRGRLSVQGCRVRSEKKGAQTRGVKTKGEGEGQGVEPARGSQKEGSRRDRAWWNTSKTPVFTSSAPEQWGHGGQNLERKKEEGKKRRRGDLYVKSPITRTERYTAERGDD